MKLEERPGGFALYKEKTEVGCCQLTRTAAGADVACLTIVPEWRRKGYGSYLLKEILRRFGGYDRETATVFTAPLPAVPGEEAFWAKFGFREEAGRLCRRRTPDLTAVKFVQDFLAARLQNPQLLVDATCGNGHDTLFLCSVAGENGRVIGLDIQPQAAANTNALLAANGMAAIGRAECCDHRELLRFAPPGSADCVMFNFGWLPGAAHDVHSTADSTLPALQAGLDALKPGGVLAAVLYSGKVIGNAEKKAAAEFFRSLPLADYTVLICEFANWADTAPLPCLLLKK